MRSRTRRPSWVMPLRVITDKGRAHRPAPHALSELRRPVQQRHHDNHHLRHHRQPQRRGHRPRRLHHRRQRAPGRCRCACRQAASVPAARPQRQLLEIVAVRVGFCTAFAESIDKLVENLGSVKPTFMAGCRASSKVYGGLMATVAGRRPVKWKLVNWGARRLASPPPESGRTAAEGPSGDTVQIIADSSYSASSRERFGGQPALVQLSAARVSRELAEFFHAAGMLILEGYGLTETELAHLHQPGPTTTSSAASARSGSQAPDRIAADGGSTDRRRSNLPRCLAKTKRRPKSIDADGWFPHRRHRRARCRQVPHRSPTTKDHRISGGQVRHRTR